MNDKMGISDNEDIEKVDGESSATKVFRTIVCSIFLLIVGLFLGAYACVNPEVLGLAFNYVKMSFPSMYISIIISAGITYGILFFVKRYNEKNKKSQGAKGKTNKIWKNVRDLLMIGFMSLCLNLCNICYFLLNDVKELDEYAKFFIGYLFLIMFIYLVEYIYEKVFSEEGYNNFTRAEKHWIYTISMVLVIITAFIKRYLLKQEEIDALKMFAFFLMFWVGLFVPILDIFEKSDMKKFGESFRSNYRLELSRIKYISCVSVAWIAVGIVINIVFPISFGTRTVFFVIQGIIIGLACAGLLASRFIYNNKSRE